MAASAGANELSVETRRAAAHTIAIVTAVAFRLMPLLARTPSLPFSTNQATALKPRVYPLGPDQPDAAIGLSERVDFHVGELDAPLAQGPEGFDRSLEKIRAELLVCQNLSDDQLHGSLRHDSHAVRRLPRFRARSQRRSRHDDGRARSLPRCES